LLDHHDAREWPVATRLREVGRHRTARRRDLDHVSLCAHRGISSYTTQGLSRRRSPPLGTRRNGLGSRPGKRPSDVPAALTPLLVRHSLKRVFTGAGMRREKANYTIQSVSHALDVLEQFSGPQAGELGVTELSKRLKLHKNNVFRLLATLESRG